MDNDIPTWKKKSSVVATNNYKGGVLAGKFLADEAEGGRHARHPRGRARRSRRSYERVTGMLAGLGALKEQDQGRLEARDRLRPDEGGDGRPDDPDGEPEPDGDLLGLRAAGARRDPVDQERRHQARRDHPGRLRRLAGRGRRRSRRATRPLASRSSRRRSARSGSRRSTRPSGQEGAEERRHRHRARDEGERRASSARRTPGGRPRRRAAAAPPGSRAHGRTMPDDRRRPPPLLEPRARAAPLDDGEHAGISANVRACRPRAAAGRVRRRRRPCSCRPPATDSDTDSMFEHAARHAWIGAVIAWVDLLLARARRAAARRARRAPEAARLPPPDPQRATTRTGSSGTTCSRASRCSRQQRADPRASLRLPAPSRRRARACAQRSRA